MRNTKQAFTLVELIVVITILAILGTIAFISLQGYSADARNSKRTSDLGNIQSAIALKNVEGVPLLSFVTNVPTTRVTSLSLAGTSATDTAYAAGNPSYTVLNVAAKDFKDPSADKDYKVGITTQKGGVFQLAATMEVDGTPTALVNGTFVQRLSTSTGTITANGNVVTLPNTMANFFKAGDTVTIAGATGATKVDKVSRDGVTLTMNGAATGGTVINLTTSESTGLIADKTTVASPVTNLSTILLPY